MNGQVECTEPRVEQPERVCEFIDRALFLVILSEASTATRRSAAEPS
jgi:hypothetical protein